MQTAKAQPVRQAAASQAPTAIALLVALIAFVSYLALEETIARVEVSLFPVITHFEQTSAECVGNDVVVSGTLHKARGLDYLPGRQRIVLVRAGGVTRRLFWRAMDQPDDTPVSRDTGLQEWGPWLLLGACGGKGAEWFTIVEHETWHPWGPLTSITDPMPLPSKF